MKRIFFLIFCYILLFLLIIYLFGLLYCFLIPSECSAQTTSITFAWKYDPNITDLEGFFLYERDQNQLVYDYNQPVSPLIDGNERSYTRVGALTGTKFWVMRARSVYGDYSPNSNEVSYALPLVTPSKFGSNDLMSGDTADVLFMDGKALQGMVLISYDYEKNLWHFRRPGLAAKDFFFPEAAIKAIVKIN